MEEEKKLEAAPVAADKAPEVAPKEQPHGDRPHGDRPHGDRPHGKGDRPHGKGDRKGHGDRRNREDEPKEFEETVVEINRIAKTVKGGRRMRFSALVVIGNKKGNIVFLCFGGKFNLQIVFSILNRIGYNLSNHKCTALAIGNNGNIQTIQHWLSACLNQRFGICL